MLSKTVKARTARDMKANSGTFESELVPGTKVVSSTHMMAQVNTPIVHATAEAEGFEFEYRERSLGGGRRAWEKATAKAAAAAAAADSAGDGGDSGGGALGLDLGRGGRTAFDQPAKSGATLDHRVAPWHPSVHELLAH